MHHTRGASLHTLNAILKRIEDTALLHMLYSSTRPCTDSHMELYRESMSVLLLPPLTLLSVPLS